MLTGNCKFCFSYFSLLFIVLLMSCKNDIEKINAIASDTIQSLPAESSIGVEFIYSDSAHIQMKLNAGQIDRYGGENAYFEMPKGLHVTFYKHYPNVETELKADYGLGFDSSNGIDSMEVKRNVEVINVKGDKLTTEHLIWDARKKKIFTNEFVKITTKEEVLWGEGLEADESFSQFEIKNVQGQINIKDTIQ